MGRPASTIEIPDKRHRSDRDNGRYTPDSDNSFDYNRRHHRRSPNYDAYDRYYDNHDRRHHNHNQQRSSSSPNPRSSKAQDSLPKRFGRDSRNGNRSESESDEELKGLNPEEYRRLKRQKMRRALTRCIWNCTPSPPRNENDNDNEKADEISDKYGGEDELIGGEKSDSSSKEKAKVSNRKGKSESQSNSESESESETDDSRSRRKRKRKSSISKSKKYESDESEGESESDEEEEEERKQRKKTKASSRNWSRHKSSNKLEPPIFLRIATNLQSLDLSNNKIHGQTPKWLGAVGRNSLNFLDLSHNFLTSIDKIPWKNIKFVDLRNNLLQGLFPTLNSLNLLYLFASHNNLTGEIPSLICNASFLKVLDLSNNNLSGTIPKCLVLSNELLVLDLRMNSLNGTIPATFSRRSNLRNINLNGNQLEGSLPRSLENCRNLECLDLGNNKINDTFPYWLGSILELRVLVIRSNKFRGCIGHPKTQFSFLNLRILDISNNDFNGPLPINFFKYLKAMMNATEGEARLKYVGGMRNNYYHDSLNVTMKGVNIELVRIQTVFTTIDFSNNRFIGEMPQIIGRLKSLLGVNFSHNNLTGYIPSLFGNLTNLEWLDLSFNKLGGEIPKQLADLPWLEVLKLSHNQLVGHIPLGKQFNTFDNDSYIENSGLCGYPLSRTCNNHESKQPPPSTLQQEDNLEPKNGFGWQAVSIGYGCGVIFGTLMGYLMFKIGKPKWIVRMVKLEQHILLRRLKKNAPRNGGRK